MKVQFINDAVQNINFILKREWMEKNKGGCYAAQSIPGINTRRSHGLFSFIPEGYEEMVNILGNLEESVKINDFSYYFSTTQYKEHISPNGYRFMSEFTSSPNPRYTFKVQNVIIQKDLLIHPEMNTLLIRYKFINHEYVNLKLILKPYFTFKKIFELKKSHSEMATDAYEEDYIINYRPYDDDLSVYFSLSDSNYVPAPLWYYNFWHIYDFPAPSEEDYFNPGFFELDVGKKDEYFFCISDQKINPMDAELLFKKELKRREQIYTNIDDKKFLEKELSVQLEKYIDRIGEDVYIKNSPLDTKLNVDLFLVMFPFLLRLKDTQTDVLKAYFTIKKLMKQNFLPDQYKYYSHTKIFETPLPSFLFLSSTYFALIADPTLVPRLVDQKYFEAIMHGILQNKFLRLKMDNKGWLKYKKGETQYEWINPLGIGSIPLRMSLDEIFLNILWYNSICAFIDLTKSEKKYFLKRMEKYRKNLRKQLEQISLDNSNFEDCLLRDILILIMPFLPLPEIEKQKINRRVKANLTPFGLKINFNQGDKQIELALPVGLYLYLFYLLSTMDPDKFKRGLNQFLVTGINHLYDGGIMNYSEAFQIINGKFKKFGDNYSGINLTLFDYWIQKKNQMEIAKDTHLPD